MNKQAYERVVGAVLIKQAGALDDAMGWAKEHKNELIGAGVGALGGGALGYGLGGDATSTLLGALGGGAVGWGGGSLYDSLAGAGGDEAAAAEQLAAAAEANPEVAAAVQEGVNQGMSANDIAAALGYTTAAAAGGAAIYGGGRQLLRNVRAGQLKNLRRGAADAASAAETARKYSMRRSRINKLHKNMSDPALFRLQDFVNKRMYDAKHAQDALTKAKSGGNFVKSLPSVREALAKLIARRGR